MFKFNIALALVCLYIVHCCLAQDVVPNVVLSNLVPPADTYSLSLKQNDPSLSASLNGVRYFCHNSGVWIFYQHAYNYQEGGWIQSSPRCLSRPSSNVTPIRSVGFLGSSRNSSVPTINLFEETFWGKLLEVSSFTASVSNYTRLVRSVVVTGGSSVTFYKSQNFEGESICLEEALDGELASYEGQMSSWGFAPNDTKSFRFGCFSSRRVGSGGARA